LRKHAIGVSDLLRRTANMLRRRGKTYQTRAFVPVDLQPLMHRAEIVKSMGTGDRDDAVLLASEWNHRVLKLSRVSSLAATQAATSGGT
jgi:hypothetical protein